jgi:hypothetical protein
MIATPNSKRLNKNFVAFCLRAGFWLMKADLAAGAEFVGKFLQKFARICKLSNLQI